MTRYVLPWTIQIWPGLIAPRDNPDLYFVSCKSCLTTEWIDTGLGEATLLGEWVEAGFPNGYLFHRDLIVVVAQTPCPAGH